jgi:hypothetical protein
MRAGLHQAGKPAKDDGSSSSSSVAAAAASSSSSSSGVAEHRGTVGIDKDGVAVASYNFISGSSLGRQVLNFGRRSDYKSVFRPASLPEEDEEALLLLPNVNVTEQSRSLSLIPLEAWNRTMTSSSVQTETKKKSLRKRLVSGLSKRKDFTSDSEQPTDTPLLQKAESSSGAEEHERHGRLDRKQDRRRAKSDNEADSDDASKTSKSKRGSFVGRMRSLSRSRSRSRSRKTEDGDVERPKTIVTVTSCRSDGYYNEKAPGSTSKLPRKAPTNLKLFHELAVGVKDAYAAVGQTPTKPVLESEETGEKMSEQELYSRSVLWEFIGNIDFVSRSILCVCRGMTTDSLSSFLSSIVAGVGRRGRCRHGYPRCPQRRYNI